MDALSATVVTSSLLLAYINSNRGGEANTANKTQPSTTTETFTTENDPQHSKSQGQPVNNKGIDPAVARSVDFLKIRLRTMLSEGTLTDVKAVCRQIEDAGFEDLIPDYARAQNIIASVPNPQDQVKIVTDPTRYQNQSLTNFVQNNFVPFFSGRNTQNMVGTGVASGNWKSANDASTITQMRNHTGNDPYVKPLRSTRNPETTIFKPGELTVDNTVWGAPLTRPELDRYVDITSSRPDLKPVENIQVGPGLQTDPNKNAHDRGFHDIYQPRDDALRKINSTMKVATEQHAPPKGRSQGGGKTSSQMPYAGGITAGVEGFSQDAQQSFQGKSFVVKKCNDGGAKDWEQFATRGMGGTRPTGEHGTEQLLRGETQRGQATPNTVQHFPGLKTGEVKRHTEHYSGENPASHNIKLSNMAIDRERQTRQGLPTGVAGNQIISGHDSGPGKFYVNDTYTDNKQLPILNATGIAGQYGARKVSERVDQQANTTNRQFQTNSHTEMLQYGARGNTGHQSSLGDATTQTHRSSANSSDINHGGMYVPKIKTFNTEENDRSNLRAGTLVSGRPQMAHSNVVAPLKVRVGTFKLNDLRSDSEVKDRPQANTARMQNEWKQGDNTVRDTKMVENYRDPRTGMKLNKGYAVLENDSKSDCRNDSNILDGV